jgi:hypothetical protein
LICFINNFTDGAAGSSPARSKERTTSATVALIVKVILGGYKVKSETIERLRSSATQAGYTHGKDAASGEFLDAIAQINPLLLAELTKQ